MRELSINVLDIVQNSIAANASLIEVHILEDNSKDILTIKISDNGFGMTKEQLSKVDDPFFTTRTTRKIGLGVPLFKMSSELTGGKFSIQSNFGKGTTVTASFFMSHLDIVPLGDMNSTISLLIRCNPNKDFVFKRVRGENSFSLDTRDLRKTLENEVPLDNKEVIDWINEFLKEQTENIFGGASI